MQFADPSVADSGPLWFDTQSWRKFTVSAGSGVSATPTERASTSPCCSCSARVALSFFRCSPSGCACYSSSSSRDRCGGEVVRDKADDLGYDWAPEDTLNNFHRHIAVAIQKGNASVVLSCLPCE